LIAGAASSSKPLILVVSSVVKVTGVRYVSTRPKYFCAGVGWYSFSFFQFLEYVAAIPSSRMTSRFSALLFSAAR
jgi:hypothetical protein